MNNNSSEYLNFIDEALELAKKLPRHFSKFSNKIYDNHQKLVIVVLMQKLKMTSRDIVKWLEVNEFVRLSIGLSRVPVHTTILRFLKKVKNLIGKLLDIRQADSIAIDSTGFEAEQKSYYYRTVWNSEKKQKARRYVKLSVAVDTDKQLILTHKIRMGPRNDNIDFKGLLKELKVQYVIADKAYSSRKNRDFVFYNLRAKPIIPRKKNEGGYNVVHGRYKIEFDDKLYHQRSKVETVFSVIKRKYGSVLRSKKFATQRVELICKLIAYNLDRKIKIYFLFLRIAPEPKTTIFINIINFWFEGGFNWKIKQA